MATTPLFRYPLDPTGVNPSNLVIGEVHALPNRTVRAFAPLYGAFFTQGLVIKDVATGNNLTSLQFKAVELYEFPTGRYGKEICGVILIMDTSVSNNVEVSYQALGGDYSTNTDAIISMLNTISLDNRPVGWPDIIGKPDGFTPSAHYHDVGDIYGFEYVVDALERIRSAITDGDAVGHEAILAYIDSWGNSLSSSNGGVSGSLATHLLNVNNPHQTTKAQVGLSNVQNYTIATTQDATTGTSNVVYMTPAQTTTAINTVVPPLIAAHSNRTDNPHSTNAAQVGLGNVQNFGLATTGSAQTGTSTTQYMTPALTAAAISSQAATLINAHTSRTDNPHATTAVQVGLDQVWNYGLATTSQAQNGTAANAYMTPVLTAAAITAQALTPLNTHTARTDNPHSVTAAQIGLGNVQNYGIATTSQAQAGTATTVYMTPALTAAYVTQYNSTLQTSFAGDIVFSSADAASQDSRARRVIVQGQAISLATYPTLAFLWCGATYNALNANDALQADFYYRCTDAANPSTTRSNTGTYLVLPPAGYFMRPYNAQSTGVDALRGRYKLQADDLKSHNHANGVTPFSNGDGFGPYGGIDTGIGTTYHSGQAGLNTGNGLTSTVGGTESRPKNWPVYVYMVY